MKPSNITYNTQREQRGSIRPLKGIFARIKPGKIFAILFTAAAFTACEDVIDVEVPEGKTYTVVDAWLTNTPGRQDFRITQSVPYTNQAPAPIVSDAVVTLTDMTSGQVYPFAFANGKYSNDPGAAVSIGVVGHIYKLRVELKESTFEAIDTLKRVPVIDSISYEFKTAENAASGEEGFYARWYGKDIAGATDYYWIRSYRNNTDNRVADAFAIDGSFEAEVADGSVFIYPLSEAITREDKPFLLNEKVIVRLASVTEPSHDFLEMVQSQLNNGGLFAEILANVPSNLKNVNTGSKAKVLGWFGTSAVQFKERVMLH
ncbi:DUF4249 domain-containing protein [Chitinophaga barathri]|uniref:DUF4249 domain-containing protein n=1 Tax=Chitinophaga barathri TaxID=1647451 RepID=A0A3N4N1Z0_9BACT|nr:DUF4249 domain-containing protein [Chitinophaga barathri]RPD41643.1 DUF4249 domain-containing protein [Chitinophaga barathri]